MKKINSGGGWNIGEAQTTDKTLISVWSFCCVRRICSNRPRFGRHHRHGNA